MQGRSAWSIPCLYNAIVLVTCITIVVTTQYEEECQVLVSMQCRRMIFQIHTMPPQNNLSCKGSTHWGLMTPFDVMYPSEHCSKWWLVICSVPSHYLNQCWLVNLIIRNKWKRFWKCLQIIGFFFFLFFSFFFLRLGLGQRRAVVIIGRWLLPSLVDTGDICCHYWQHILVSIVMNSNCSFLDRLSKLPVGQPGPPIDIHYGKRMQLVQCLCVLHPVTEVWSKYYGLRSQQLETLFPQAPPPLAPMNATPAAKGNKDRPPEDTTQGALCPLVVQLETIASSMVTMIQEDFELLVSGVFREATTMFRAIQVSKQTR